MSCIALIPAKGSSERLPLKNLRTFFGKPIISYSIETALASELFSEVYVSTEDERIAAVAAAHGAIALHREPSLCDDHIGTQDVMQHHIVDPRFRETTHACVIYPCAPLMTTDDLHEGYRRLLTYGADFAFSVGTEPLRDAGAWYWGTVKAFAEGRPLFGPDSLMIPLPRERVVDINDERDWLRAELLYQAMKKKAA